MSQSAHKPEPDLIDWPLSLSSRTASYREYLLIQKKAIAIINPDGSYLEQNGAHYTLLGYSDRELEVSTRIHLDRDIFEDCSQLAELRVLRGSDQSKKVEGRNMNSQPSHEEWFGRNHFATSYQARHYEAQGGGEGTPSQRKRLTISSRLLHRFCTGLTRWSYSPREPSELDLLATLVKSMLAEISAFMLFRGNRRHPARFGW